MSSFSAQTTFPSTLSETYLYDAAGNLVSKTDRTGHFILYVHDAMDRFTHKGYTDSTGVDYHYDLAGKLQQVKDPTGTHGRVPLDKSECCQCSIQIWKHAMQVDDERVGHSK